MEMQEIFEKALRGVVGQKQLAKDSSGSYYIMDDENGNELRCAVGHLVDRERAQVFNNIGGSFWSVFKTSPTTELASSAHDPRIGLLMDIQGAHDRAGDFRGRDAAAVNDFIERMRAIATGYELTFPDDVVPL